MSQAHTQAHASILNMHKAYNLKFKYMSASTNLAHTKLVFTNAEVTVAKIQQNILQKRLTSATVYSIIHTYTAKSMSHNKLCIFL